MNEALAADDQSQGTNEGVTDLTTVTASDVDTVLAAPVVEEQVEDKKLSGFAKRMQRLESSMSAQVEATKVELEYWKGEALKRATPAEPVRGRLDFGSDEEWIDSRLEAEREKLLADARGAALETVRVEQVVAGYQTRVNEAKKELPDWDTVFAEAVSMGTGLPQDAIDFIVDSPAGPKIAYHLAKNEAEFTRLTTLTPLRRAAELGKLEDRLATTAVPKNTVSRAPAKLAEVKTGTSTKLAPTGPDRFASKAAWKEWRAGQSTRR